MSENRFDNLFIFEMANSHQGSVDHGLRIIEEMGRIARKHALNGAIKFQFRDLDTFIHPAALADPNAPHVPRFLATRLSANDFQTFVGAARAEGLVPIATPFDEASVGQCVEQGIDIIKIASCSSNDWPLLEAGADAGKPVIVSTGGKDVGEIDNVVSFFTHRAIRFALMHCIALYPAPSDSIHMSFLARMRQRYPGVPVGYSGHEAPDDTDVVKMAVAMGATILERHVGLPTDSITLNAYSLTPEQVDTWAGAALRAHEIAGDAQRPKIEGEAEALRQLARGVYAARDIPAGAALRQEDIYFAMPCHDGQTTSGEFGQYRATFVASRDYARDDAIAEPAERDTISVVREIIHDAKGMLYEAQVVVGDDFEIELSHHFGIEKFRDTGAMIVTVVNREYCKKLVIVLPNQWHPNHYHAVKEETFQVLWGTLDIVVDGISRSMVPGETLLIERGAWHSFNSDTGAIIEEISTTHVRGDSYYEDERIARLDPMERKTIIDTW